MTNIVKRALYGLAVLVLFASCTVPNSVDWNKNADETGVNNRDAAIITDYNLQVYVPIPINGVVPVKRVTSLPSVDVTVVWRDKDYNDITDSLSVFKVKEVYRADITLTAKGSYAFDSTRSFMYPANSVGEQPQANTDTATRRLTTVIYKATAEASSITDVDLAPYVPEPIRGGTPLLSFSAPQYTGKVEWYQGLYDPQTASNRTPHSGLFDGLTAYSATVTLAPVAGWRFNEMAADFKYSSTLGSAVVNLKLDDGAATVYINFQPTSNVPVKTVDDFNLNSYIPRPIVDGVPVYFFDGKEYRGTVAWSEPISLFRANKVYTATVTLTAFTGWTLPGEDAPEDVFTHTGAESIRYNWSSGTVAIKFIDTDPLAQEVDDLDLTFRIPAPISNGTPELAVDTPYYKGTVKWTAGNTEHNGLFKDSTDYTATVTLKVVSGYTLKDKVFTHTSPNTTITTVPSTDGGSALVTITFPTTAASSQSYTGPLQGNSGLNGDSIVDLVKGAGVMGVNSLKLDLSPMEDVIRIKYGSLLDMEAGWVLTKGVTSPGDVVIDGNGRELQLTEKGFDIPIITVGNGVTLTLQNITLENKVFNYSGSSGSPLILVNNGGKLIIGQGVNITRNAYPLTLTGEGGQGDRVGGQGVYVASGGTLELEGGTINENTGPGVVIAAGGLFTMNSGMISSNGASGVVVEGQAVMKGGSIDGNFTFNGSGKVGAGVYIKAFGEFIMDGGTISDNNADNAGGGVYVDHSGTFKMSHGIISGNKVAGNGGGVYVAQDGTFGMADGIISGNRAEGGNGGGVYVAVDEEFSKEDTGGTIYGEDGGALSNYAFNSASTAAYAERGAGSGIRNTAGPNHLIYVYAIIRGWD
jgi:hypothetical protein